MNVFKEIIIKDTHRGLLYQDGVLQRVLEAGRFEKPKPKWLELFQRQPRIEVVLVDVRQRELTIKGQEILTADKVAIRVSILVQFQVTDPTAATHNVANFEDSLYSDVQLAARRSLAAMTLEEILTNRNRLSEEILADVQDSAAGYGVAIRRADVKDLIFPGNLQEIMNRVLAAERNSEAQLVEARTRSEVDKIAAQTNAEIARVTSQAEADALRVKQVAQAESEKARAEIEAEVFQIMQSTGQVLAENPSLLRLEEIKSLAELARNANARIYFGVDQTGHAASSK